MADLTHVLSVNRLRRQIHHMLEVVDPHKSKTMNADTMIEEAVNDVLYPDMPEQWTGVHNLSKVISDFDMSSVQAQAFSDTVTKTTESIMEITCPASERTERLPMHIEWRDSDTLLLHIVDVDDIDYDDDMEHYPEDGPDWLNYD